MKSAKSINVAITSLLAIACASDPSHQEWIGSDQRTEGAALSIATRGAWFTTLERSDLRRRVWPASWGTLEPGTATPAEPTEVPLSSGAAGAGATSDASESPPDEPPPSDPTDAGTTTLPDQGAGQSTGAGSAEASPFPGGFLEPTTSTQVRAPLTRAQLQTLLPPAGGTFVFPAPYGTEAIRVTDADSCGGSGDCVRYLGYSYWRNTNNHVGQSTMLVLVGLDTRLGGAGLSLFRYHKDTDALESLGPIFAGTGIDTNATGEGIYFSGTRPTTAYVAQGPRLLRFDVITRTSEVVFDASGSYGTDTYLWQHHSSDDDVVHSATLRASNTGAVLGCLVYREDTAAFRLFAAGAGFDECQVDRSGDWLVIKDNIDGRNGEDNRIIDLHSFAEVDLLDEDGAAGHSDLGFGVLVAEDNWNALPGAVRAWRLGHSPLQGPVVYHDPAWRTEGSSHISHTNARSGVAIEDQVACSSTVARTAVTRGSEIFCYRLDGSLQVMVVAPVMTDLDASGGGDDYAKAPKGNLDVTGRYFIWTSNAGGDRLDAFIVKVPALLGAD